MKFEAVLFDMDGLMFDTEHLADEVFAQEAPAFGIQVGPKEMALLRGRNHAAGKAAFQALYGADFPFDALSSRVGVQLKRRVAQEKPLKPGLLELLEFCRQRAIPCAVASSSDRSLVEEYLTGTGVRAYFKALVCGDDIRNSKPAPDIYWKAAEKLGADPARCLVLEDSYNGVRAGAAAGCRVVMVPDIDPPTPEMEALAWHIAKSLADVPAWMDP